MEPQDTGAHDRPGRRPLLTVAAVALAIAAVPAGVALAGSGGESSGGEAQAPDATFIQDQAPRGETPPGDGDRRDGHDCPKDRQGQSSGTTAL
jgi:nitrous oxide reductase